MQHPPEANRAGRRLFLLAPGRSKFRCRSFFGRGRIRRLRGLRPVCALAAFPGPWLDLARNSGRWFLLLARRVACVRIRRQRKLRTSWMRLFSSAKRCWRSSMCSAMGPFMVSDFSLGVILQRSIAVATEAWRGTPRLDRLLRFSLSRRRRASALQEMLAGATMRFVSLGRYRSAARLL